MNSYYDKYPVEMRRGGTATFWAFIYTVGVLGGLIVVGFLMFASFDGTPESGSNMGRCQAVMAAPSSWEAGRSPAVAAVCEHHRTRRLAVAGLVVIASIGCAAKARQHYRRIE